jgi:hypothetical protein
VAKLTRRIEIQHIYEKAQSTGTREALETGIIALRNLEGNITMGDEPLLLSAIKQLEYMLQRFAKGG